MVQHRSGPLNAYLPQDLLGAMLALMALPIVLAVGYVVPRIPSAMTARSVAWLMAIGGVSAMELYTIEQPAGFRMLAIIAILLYTMKVVVATEARLSGKASLGFWQWIAFAGCWVGMRPTLFAKMPRSPRASFGSFFARGAKNLIGGILLIGAARAVWLATNGWDRSPRLLLATVLLLPGLSLVLHFGLFNFLASFWRWMGVECNAIFRAPLASKSLAEFWGKRWNLAFSEMTTLAVYRPLRDAWGTFPATLMAFLFSGLLHELAISVPVRTGFGGPLLYFALHGVGMTFESRNATLAATLASRPWLGRLWTWAWVLIPLPILFHSPFLRGCVWPLIGIDW